MTPTQILRLKFVDGWIARKAVDNLYHGKQAYASKGASEVMEQRLLSIEQAAAYLGISPRSVRSYIKEGHLQVVRLGRRVLLDRERLDEWISKHATHASKRGE